MAKKRFLYDINAELAQAIETMLHDIISQDRSTDTRVLLDTNRYRVIGMMRREPNKKLGKADTILCVAHVKLLESGFLNLAPPVSKYEFHCKAGKRGLKGKTIHEDIAHFTQMIGMDIDFALTTRRRNFTPEFIEKLRRQIHDDTE